MVKSFQAHATRINRIKQSPFNNQYVATCSADGTVKIWNVSVTNWTLIRTYTGHTSELNELEYVNEDTMATGGYDQTIHIWSLSTGITNRIINTSSTVWSLNRMCDGFNLVVGLANPKILI